MCPIGIRLTRGESMRENLDRNILLAGYLSLFGVGRWTVEMNLQIAWWKDFVIVREYSLQLSSTLYIENAAKQTIT